MRYLTATLCLSVLFCLYGCDKSDDLIVDETQGVEYEVGDLFIDKYGNKGYVCKKKKGTSYEYIMVVSADEGYTSWGLLDLKVAPYDTLKSNSMSLLFDFFGIAMLHCTKSIGIEKFPAQKWCDDKNYGDKYPSGASWHLPTASEIECFKSISDIDSLLGVNNKYYWSCIEDIKGCDGFIIPNENYLPKDRAMPVNLDGETTRNKDLWVKRNKYYVRAVKYIYYKRD